MKRTLAASFALVCAMLSTPGFAAPPTYTLDFPPTPSASFLFCVDTSSGPPYIVLACDASHPVPVTIIGGGGGAVTIADGADVALGSTADAAWSGSGSGTIVATSKYIGTQIALMSAKLPASLGVKTAANSLSFAPASDSIFPASESGTWTMQPGNTANTTPWLFSNNDGTNTQKVLGASTSPALTDKAGVVALSPNPSPVCTSVLPISQATSTDLHTMTNIGYICTIILVTDTAQFVSLTEGTGSTCGSGSAALLGSTTVGSGMSFTANGGISAVNGFPWLKMVASADHLCLLQSGSGRLSGVITYQDHA
jgi:hypothetical protein